MVHLNGFGVYPSHRVSSIPAKVGILFVYKRINVNFEQVIVETGDSYPDKSLRQSLAEIIFSINLQANAVAMTEEAPKIKSISDQKDIAFAYILLSDASEYNQKLAAGIAEAYGYAPQSNHSEKTQELVKISFEIGNEGFAWAGDILDENDRNSPKQRTIFI